MRRVMLPAVISAAIAAVYLIAVSTVYLIPVAALYIRVPVEIVIHVDVHIAAAPAAAVAPPSAPHGPHRHSNSEGNRHASRIVARRWIGDWGIRIDRRSIDNRGVVARNINHLRIRLFDNNDLFRLDDLRFDFLLFVRFQVAFVLSLLAHPLNRVHHVTLLRKERIP